MKRIKPSEGNKTFCMAPWTHTYLSPQTERRMCCASREPAQSFKQYIDTGNIAKKYKPLTLTEHWNSDHMKSVRLRLRKRLNSLLMQKNLGYKILLICLQIR